MNDKIDEAIMNVLAMIRANAKAEESLSLSQAVLNLSNAKATLHSLSVAEDSKKKETFKR